MAQKNLFVGRFREFKASPPLLLPLPVSLLYTHSLPPQALRRWDRAVRARKFAERVRHAERTMLQANKEHWACVARVHTECVRLTEEVGEEKLQVLSTGVPLESITADIQRRRDALKDALDVARERIGECMERFFASVSSAVQVTRLREVFRLNRQGKHKQAVALAGADMLLLARVAALCEHMVCQAASELFNSEMRRLMALIDSGARGVIHTEAAFSVRFPQALSIRVPMGAEDAAVAAAAVELTTAPSAGEMRLAVLREFAAVQRVLERSMRAGLLPRLSEHVAPDVLAPLAQRPDFMQTVTSSRDFHHYSTRLGALLGAADAAAREHLQRTLGPLKPVLAYLEAFRARGEAELQAGVLQGFPAELEQYTAWQAALARMHMHETEAGALRLRYRKLKLQVQETLQTRVMDSRFDMYKTAVIGLLGDLKLSAARLVAELGRVDAEQHFGALAAWYGTLAGADTAARALEERFAGARRHRELLAGELTRAREARAETRRPTPGERPALRGGELGWAALPALPAGILEEVREAVQTARVRQINRVEAHGRLALAEQARWEQAVGALARDAAHPALRSLRTPAGAAPAPAPAASPSARASRAPSVASASGAAGLAARVRGPEGQPSEGAVNHLRSASPGPGSLSPAGAGAHGRRESAQRGEGGTGANGSKGAWEAVEALPLLARLRRGVDDATDAKAPLARMLEQLGLPPLAGRPSARVFSALLGETAALEELWEVVAAWQAVGERTLGGALAEVREAGLDTDLDSLLRRVAVAARVHEGHPLAAKLAAAAAEVERDWPALRRLLDPALREAHLARLLQAAGHGAHAHDAATLSLRRLCALGVHRTPALDSLLEAARANRAIDDWAPPNPRAPALPLDAAPAPDDEGHAAAEAAPEAAPEAAHEDPEASPRMGVGMAPMLSVRPHPLLFLPPLRPLAPRPRAPRPRRAPSAQRGVTWPRQDARASSYFDTAVNFDTAAGVGARGESTAAETLDAARDAIEALEASPAPPLRRSPRPLAPPLAQP